VPEIQKNIRYFYASHLEIFTNKGIKVSPESVPWHRLNANYFPYEMVQRTGYWNTLGLLKFQFDNPFKMYLHDTSEKKLFAKEKRFYSHSCIRLEKPLEFGKLLLNGNSIALDTLNPKTKQVDIKPIYLPVKRTIPIIIWYSPIDFTAEGEMKIYEDVYRKL
jgi:murein L,D-transpeptidase YcbB/YkuD